MHLCYVDESGTPDIPGNTSHFVLAGLSIPVKYWKSCDDDIERIKRKYNIAGSEIHTAWILRPYLEQTQIPDFASLDYKQRRSQVKRLRNAEILRLQRSGNSKLRKQTRKNYNKTEAYIHLTYDKRRELIVEIAQCIAGWGFARLFAECIDKIFFDPQKTHQTVDEQSFEQIVSRFEQYLQIIERSNPETRFGLIVHDNNETNARRYTELMKSFYKKGTLWTNIRNIIETPLFVDSQLTNMVQIADVCAYAIRRYLENSEEELFDLIFQRADRKDGIVVGVRHFTDDSCDCKICSAHRK